MKIYYSIPHFAFYYIYAQDLSEEEIYKESNTPRSLIDATEPILILGEPIQVEGEEVFRIYSGIGSFTIQQRAEAISQMLNIVTRSLSIIHLLLNFTLLYLFITILFSYFEFT